MPDPQHIVQHHCVVCQKPANTPQYICKECWLAVYENRRVKQWQPPKPKR